MYSYQTEISRIYNTQHSSVFFHYGCIYIIVISILCGIGYTIYTKIIQLLKDLTEKYEVKLKNNVNDFNIRFDKMEIKYQDYIQKLERQINDINDMKDIVEKNMYILFKKCDENIDILFENCNETDEHIDKNIDILFENSNEMEKDIVEKNKKIDILFKKCNETNKKIDILFENRDRMDESIDILFENGEIEDQRFEHHNKRFEHQDQNIANSFIKNYWDNLKMTGCKS